MTYTPDPEQRYDRHLRLAGTLTGTLRNELIRKFVGQRVLLTGERYRLSTRSGRLMFMASANLIARFCPKIDLLLDPSARDLAEGTLNLLRRLDSSMHAEFRAVESATAEYAAVLTIGRLATSSPNEIMIDAAGWLAAISTDGAPA